MFECLVLLNTLDKVKEFCSITILYDLTIDAKSEKYIVDGKSILGLLSLNLMNPIKLVVWGDQKIIRNFVDEISPYMV